MDAYEILDLIASQLSIINEAWNFFLTIHLGIIGLLIITRHFIRIPVKIVIIGAYLGFSYVNYSAQNDNYTQLGALYEDAKLLQESGAFDVDAGRLSSGAAAANYDLTVFSEYLPYAYGLTAIMTFLCLAFANALQGREPGD